MSLINRADGAATRSTHFDGTPYRKRAAARKD